MKIFAERLFLFVLFLVVSFSTLKAQEKRPNILFAISDDQTYLHTSFAGCSFVKTPAFDRIAREGIYFSACYAGSPGCAPSRSTIVTGRYHWQNEQSGQHASSWLKKYVPFVDLIQNNGYYIGRTGKGVGPFQYARNENDSLWRKENAAGPLHSDIRYTEEDDERYAGGIHATDYFENFKYFIDNQPEGQPFFFWYGGYEPHRSYEQDSWKRRNKNLNNVQVPAFLPDNEIIRGDLLDYAVEIEWFDLHLQRMLNYLEEIGELENTIVIVTGDNGMPFPRAKANCFEYGAHVPLAIRFPKKFPQGKKVDSPVSFVDFAPTILELTQTSSEGMQPIRGKSMKKLLENPDDSEAGREYVFSGRERHSSSRYKNWGYPQRAVRNKDFLLIWNIKPERWPAGAPQRINPEKPDELLPMYGIDANGELHSDWAFTDIDASPSKSYIVENHNDKNIYKYFDWSVGKRPEFELYNIQDDPECLNNLAGKKDFKAVEKKMKAVLMAELKATGDPRVGDNPEVFDTYIRYSPMREFPAPLK